MRHHHLNVAKLLFRTNSTHAKLCESRMNRKKISVEEILRLKIYLKVNILDLFIIKIHLSVGGAKPNDVEQTVLIIHPLNNVLCHFILLFIQFAI